MKKPVLVVIVMAMCLYICTAIIFWPDLIAAHARRSTLVLVLYHVCPWLLTWLSIKGWYQSFVWRRMVQQRSPDPTLSRGEHRFDVRRQRKSLVEHLCQVSLLISLWALGGIWL